MKCFLDIYQIFNYLPRQLLNASQIRDIYHNFVIRSDNIIYIRNYQNYKVLAFSNNDVIEKSSTQIQNNNAQEEFKIDVLGNKISISNSVNPIKYISVNSSNNIELSNNGYMFELVKLDTNTKYNIKTHNNKYLGISNSKLSVVNSPFDFNIGLIKSIEEINNARNTIKSIIIRNIISFQSIEFFENNKKINPNDIELYGTWYEVPRSGSKIGQQIGKIDNIRRMCYGERQTSFRDIITNINKGDWKHKGWHRCHHEDYIEFRFLKPNSINKIIIHERTGCCADQADNAAININNKYWLFTKNFAPRVINQNDRQRIIEF